ncbi:MAG: PcfJ domain-containing protein [Isosphaeraceae bacterium]
MFAKKLRREYAKSLIDRCIRETLAGIDEGPRQGIIPFLAEVRGRSALLSPAGFRGRVEDGWIDRILQGLLALYAHRRDWHRPLRTWQPTETNTLPIFSSLAHHLLAEYRVPPVLLSVWFDGDDHSARRRQQWFKHAGLGRSLRAVGFPLRLSKPAAHEFAHAPAHFPVEFALRWAQVRSLGGSDRLARAIAATRLGSGGDFDNGDFWASVIQMFISTSRLELAHIGLIVEYLYDQKFETRTVIIGEDTELCLGPPQPGLSLRGRTAASLYRRVLEWQSEPKHQASRTLIRWDRSPIGEFTGQDDSGRSWTIRELLDSDAMAAEGKAMHHCVASYTVGCSQGRTTIWSIGIESPEGRERAATVEVDPDNRLVLQAKARLNEDPDAPCLAILKDWAAREGLNLQELESCEPAEEAVAAVEQGG